MERKTYSRGRSAIAAARKALAHLDAFIVDIDSFPQGEKFGAVVTIRSGGGKEIAEAVDAAGFMPIFVSFGGDDDMPTEMLSEGSVEDMSNLHKEAEAEADEPEPEAPAPAVRKGGYINEVSMVMGACERAREIANSMPDAPRKEVIAACRNAGIAYGTARTQIQRVRGGK